MKPKEAIRISRINHDMRQVAKDLRDAGQTDLAYQCESAGAAVDRTAKALGITGPRVKTTAAYSIATRLYRKATGKPYGVI